MVTHPGGAGGGGRERVLGFLTGPGSAPTTLTAVTNACFSSQAELKQTLTNMKRNSN